jgi:hypothetical protein
MPRVVVEDSVALLFSEGHFPAIESPDSRVRDAVAALARDTRLNAVMIDAALRGSVGSVASVMGARSSSSKWCPIAGFVLLSVVGAGPPLYAVRGSGGSIYRA